MKVEVFKEGRFEGTLKEELRKGQDVGWSTLERKSEGV